MFVTPYADKAGLISIKFRKKKDDLEQHIGYCKTLTDVSKKTE